MKAMPYFEVFAFTRRMFGGKPAGVCLLEEWLPNEQLQAIAAQNEQVIETCRPLKDFNGLNCTHMRDEADGVMTSLEETFRIGREVGVPVVISHHKLVGQNNYGRSKETLDFIRRMKSISRPEKEWTSTAGISAVQRAISSLRSATVKSGDFPSFSSTATRNRSKSREPRRMMSRWPCVSGSNEPGYTAPRIAKMGARVP